MTPTDPLAVLTPEQREVYDNLLHNCIVEGRLGVVRECCIWHRSAAELLRLATSLREAAETQAALIYGAETLQCENERLATRCAELERAARGILACQTVRANAKSGRTNRRTLVHHTEFDELRAVLNMAYGGTLP